MFAIILSIVICLLMIFAIIFKPTININGVKIQTFWFPPFIGAIILLFTHSINTSMIINDLFASGSMNPIKILILFFSMTLLSVFLDELGFFKCLAKKTVKNNNSNQLKIFISLYLIISFITIISSNDVIILTFTPFICYFAKEIKVNPIPYLFMEFVAANTWSTLLIIGNPTNIYIATMQNIGFIDYFRYMIIPTITIILSSFILMILIFRKSLKMKPEFVYDEEIKLEHKSLCIMGQIHLFLCIFLMAISNYIGLEMWYIPFIFAISLSVCYLIYKILKDHENITMINSLKRLPWILIPFVLSMFVIVFSLKESGAINILSEFLNNYPVQWSYGIFSFIIANFINNIPMSVFMSEVVMSLNGIEAFIASLSTIISSNITTILTPLGSLAGIMWLSIVKENNIEFKFIDFLKYGVIVSIPTLMTSLLTLSLYAM